MHSDERGLKGEEKQKPAQLPDSGEAPGQDMAGTQSGSEKRPESQRPKCQTAIPTQGEWPGPDP